MVVGIDFGFGFVKMITFILFAIFEGFSARIRTFGILLYNYSKDIVVRSSKEVEDER